MSSGKLSLSKSSFRDSDSKRKKIEIPLPLSENQFRILELLGEGHFGKVFKASYDGKLIDYD